MTTKKATKPKGGLDCPNCEFHIDAATVARAWFGDGAKSGRKKILRPCPKGCGLELGAREMRDHRCDGPPATPPAPLPRKTTRVKVPQK
jgi:hypothetical protein